MNEGAERRSYGADAVDGDCEEAVRESSTPRLDRPEALATDEIQV